MFLGAGCIIHAVGDNQDLRKYGGLREYLPLTYSVILIASLSLIAFPFLIGFYSKDFILKSAYGQFTFSGVAVYTIAISPQKSLVLPLSRFPFSTQRRVGQKKNVSFFVLNFLNQYKGGELVEPICKVTIPLPDGGELNLSLSFIDWLRGFSDAEGVFYFRHTKNNCFRFEFKITLHIDDLQVLNYIKSRLGFGIVNIWPKNNPTSAFFYASTQNDVAIIIAIFSKYNLNSTKHLNFLAFAKAYNIYMQNNNNDGRKKVRAALDELLLTMNDKRVNFDLTSTHEVHINSDWLLGFVEGDGSFFYGSINSRIEFAIGQKGNLALMNSIRTFLHNYSKSAGGKYAENTININYYKNAGLLQVISTGFIREVIIPLFNSLTFRSKKGLDFSDWVVI